MENKKRDFFIATINREKKEKEPETAETTNSNQVNEDEYFVSPSGRHLQKSVIPAIKGSSGPTKFEYLKGKVTIDPWEYSVQAKDNQTNNQQPNNLKKESSDYRNESSYYGLDNHNINTQEVVKEQENFVNDSYGEEKSQDNSYEYQDDVVVEDYEDDYSNEPEVVKQEFTQPKPQIIPTLEKKNVSKKRRKGYKTPPLEFLPKSSGRTNEDEAWIKEKTEVINQTFKEFNFKAEVVDRIIGPTVTQFLIKLAPGVNVTNINKFEKNIELNLCLDEGAGIRILTRVPNTTYAGIEVPNPKRQVVLLGDLIRCPEFNEQQKMLLPIAVGLDVSGKKIYADITEMPHCLIAGTTQSGKSVSLNTIILSLLYHFSPDYLKFVLVDPKQVELSTYEGIPHLAMPVITEFDDFKGTLTWLVNEMNRRYTVMSQYNKRKLVELNRTLKERNEPIVPYIVFIMDEFGDWILDGGAEVSDKIQKLGQKARAAGIHMILAAQRPSNDVVKGNIKANCDTRFAFKTSSFDDSKVIIGGSGAEKLVGRGDLLLKYGGAEPKRIQAAFIDDDNGNISNVVEYLRNEYGTEYFVDLDDIRNISRSTSRMEENEEYYDERLAEVARFIVNNQVGSSQSVSIHFRMGFPRTNKIFCELERLGIVSPAIKGKARDVLVGPDTLERILEEEKLI